MLKFFSLLSVALASTLAMAENSLQQQEEKQLNSLISAMPFRPVSETLETLKDLALQLEATEELPAAERNTRAGDIFRLALATVLRTSILDDVSDDEIDQLIGPQVRQISRKWHVVGGLCELGSMVPGALCFLAGYNVAGFVSLGVMGGFALTLTRPMVNAQVQRETSRIEQRVYQKLMAQRREELLSGFLAQEPVQRYLAHLKNLQRPRPASCELLLAAHANAR